MRKYVDNLKANRKAMRPAIGVLAALLAMGVIVYLRSCGGTGERSGGSTAGVSPLPSLEATDPSAVSAPVREAAERAEAPGNLSNFVADEPAAAEVEEEPTVLEAAEPESPVLMPSDSEAPVLVDQAPPVGPASGLPQVVPREPGQGFYGPVTVYVDRAEGSSAGVSGDENILATSPDAETMGQPEETTVESGLVQALQWYGRLRFAWDSRTGGEAVVDILTGPHRGRSMMLPLNAVGGDGAAGVTTIGDCRVLAMRENFSSPVFGEPSAGQRTLRMLHAGLRHAFAGAEAVADAYAEYLSARAQPVTVIVSAPVSTVAGGEGVVDPLIVRNEVPEPDYGSVGAAGAARSAAQAVQSLPPLPVRLPAGYFLGLAALCPEG